MLAIEFRFRGSRRVIYAKSEHVNMTGSIKDRMAYYILRRAWLDGSLGPGHTVIEATSGNTGIAFAALGRALGHPVVILMPDWMSRERMDLICSLGARMVMISREEGGFLGSVWRGPKRWPVNAKTFSCPASFPTAPTWRRTHARPVRKSGGSSSSTRWFPMLLSPGSARAAP